MIIRLGENLLRCPDGPFIVLQGRKIHFALLIIIIQWVQMFGGIGDTGGPSAIGGAEEYVLPI